MKILETFGVLAVPLVEIYVLGAKDVVRVGRWVVGIMRLVGYFISMGCSVSCSVSSSVIHSDLHPRFSQFHPYPIQNV